MDTIKRCKLQRHREAIVQDLDVKEVDAQLFAAGVLTEDDLEKISKETCRKDQARHLLDILPSKGPSAFDAFISSLTSSYPWLTEKLVAPWSWAFNVSEEEEQSLSDALLLGGLPTAPPHNVDRAGKLEEVRGKLAELKRGHYVVLHGMAGSGKSCLAARSISDKKLLIETFKGCVYWLSVGDVIVDDLLSPMCQLLDTIYVSRERPQEVPTTVKQAHLALRRAMASKPMREGLLILDDVTSSDLIEAFDIGCKTLITTKDSSCMKKVRGRDHHVELREGFKRQESLSLFAQCIGVPVSELPHQASKIHTLCKGVPMVIALIGAQLADKREDVKRNKGRWDYYLEKLTNRAYGNIHNDMGELSRDGLFGAIGMSIDNLPSHLRALYKDFALFVEDVNIKPEVLETLWGRNKYEVEDQMGEFLKKSLAVRKWNEQLNSYVYGIHDLLLYYLKQQMTDVEKQALHKKLLDRYREVCDGRFCDLPTNDNYIFSYLGYHLSQAHEWDTFKSLYFDLEFLGAKLRVSGLGDLLVDFRKYRDHITGGVPSVIEMLADVEQFVHLNGLELFQYPDLDIVQCGLQQPRRSHVYKEAVRIANERTSRLYLEYLLDHDQGTRPSTLHVKQEVMAACFSDDSNRILLADNGAGLVHLWDVEFGRILYTFRGHTEQVVHLELNPDGRQFLSASEDGSVKLWSLDNVIYQDKNSSQIFDQYGCALKTPSPRMRQDSWSNLHVNGDMKANESVHTLRHETSVRHATFSHDGLHVASCADCCVKVWDCETGSCIREVKTRDYATTCSFSSDDNLLFIGAGDFVFMHTSANVEFVSSLRNPGNIIRILPIPDCDTHLVVACSDAVHLWALEDLASTAICRADGGGANYTCAAISQDGNYVIVASTDHKIAVWEVAGNMCLVQDYQDHGGRVYVLDTYWSDTGQAVLSGSDDHTVKVWPLSPREETQHRASKLHTEFHAVWPGGGQSGFPLLAAPDTDNKIQVLNGRRLLAASAREDSPVRCCRLRPDGNLVAYGLEDGSVKVVDTNRPTDADRSPDIGRARDVTSRSQPSGGRVVLELDGAVRYLRFVDYCGPHSLVAASETTMQVWSEDRGCFVSAALTRLVQCFPLDLGRKLLTCSQDSSIRLWSGDGSCSLVVAGAPSSHVTYADNAGTHVAMADAGQAKLHLVSLVENLASPGEIRSVALGASPLRCVRFGPDARLLAAGHDTGEITVWDVKSRETVASLISHKTWVRDLVFSPWSPMVLVSAGDLIAFWDISILGQRRRRRSGTKHRLSFEPVDNRVDNIWCTKRGMGAKPELLGCVKLAGQHAVHVLPSPDFNVFATVDAGGAVYYLKVFRGLQVRAHKLTSRNKPLDG